MSNNGNSSTNSFAKNEKDTKAQKQAKSYEIDLGQNVKNYYKINTNQTYIQKKTQILHKIK